MKILQPSKLAKDQKKTKRSLIHSLRGVLKKYPFIGFFKILIPSSFLLWIYLKIIHIKSIVLNPFFLHPIFLKNLQSKKLTIEINPNLIEYYLLDWIDINGKDIHISDYFFGEGDWQNIARSFKKSTVENELKEMLTHDWDYKNSIVFQQYLTRMSEKRFKSRQHVLLDNPPKIDAYFERFHRLFLSISQNGYLSINGLKKNKVLDIDKEIGVAIGPNGELYKLPGGQHRFAIARHLQLKIPAEIRLIHIDLIKKHQIKTPSHLFKIIASFNQ